MTVETDTATAISKAPPSKGPLARYRLLSPTASVRVSPLCLGGMSFGTAWKAMMGECDQETAESILDCFYEHGGNFIDTANIYQAEQSERWIGEWMKKRGNRDQMVISTKYSSNFREGNGDTEIMVGFCGSGTKSLHTSVEASLKKLQTDYIDILYVHWWDRATSIPELMQSLNQLVASGKVLYLGISDTPAWVVSKANQYARDHGMRQFSVYQGEWSAAARDFERDIMPMCRDEGMGLMPWGTLGSGRFKSEPQRQATGGRNMVATDKHLKVGKVLDGIAKRKDTTLTSVALAYVMHKAPYVFPIVGCRTVDQLKGNIEALKVRLSEEDIAELEGAVPFDIGFPNTFFYGETFTSHPQETWLHQMAGTYDNVPTGDGAGRDGMGGLDGVAPGSTEKTRGSFTEGLEEEITSPVSPPSSPLAFGLEGSEEDEESDDELAILSPRPPQRAPKHDRRTFNSTRTLRRRPYLIFDKTQAKGFKQLKNNPQPRKTTPASRYQPGDGFSGREAKPNGSVLLTRNGKQLATGSHVGILDLTQSEPAPHKHKRRVRQANMDDNSFVTTPKKKARRALEPKDPNQQPQQAMGHPTQVKMSNSELEGIADNARVEPAPQVGARRPTTEKHAEDDTAKDNNTFPNAAEESNTQFNGHTDGDTSVDMTVIQGRDDVLDELNQVQLLQDMPEVEDQESCQTHVTDTPPHQLRLGASSVSPASAPECSATAGEAGPSRRSFRRVYTQ
ncbi:hypothetical protein VTI74DRAFT_6088 [Chaetomium olivicolor]